ncbi:MAG: hypothetical protein ABEJ36_01760 [Candidatus Nanosalina sp.]
METRFSVTALAEVLSVGVLAGTAAFMFIPFLVSGAISLLTASFMGVAITTPVIIYYLRIPQTAFDFQEYYGTRGVLGLIADILMTLLAAFAPGLIFLYGLLRMAVIPPVPVAFSAAVAVFTGYAAFLYRNRKFYESERVDIEF